MAKLKIHEIAKELDRTNKEVMEFMRAKGVDVKSHESTLEEEHLESIRKDLGKKMEDKTSEKPKKKNIIRVFRSQNASGSLPERTKKPHNPMREENTVEEKKIPLADKEDMNRIDKKTEGNQQKGNMMTEEIKEKNTQKENSAKDNSVKESTGKENVVKDNTAKETVARTTTERPQQSRPQGDRPNNRYQGDRNNNRPQGDRPNNRYQGNRPQGEGRSYQGNRPQGEGRSYQGNRPQGEGRSYQGNRPQGEGRSYQGNRPQGEGRSYQGNRPQGEGRSYQGNRPQGEGRSYQGNRPQGEGRSYQGNRPQGEGRSYQGNRPQGEGRSYQGNRPQGEGRSYQGNRPQGEGRSYQGNRPQGDGRGYQGNRPQGDRNNQGRRDNRESSSSSVTGTVDLGGSRKISRDYKKDSKQRDLKKEERKKLADAVTNRPNQGGHRPNQHLPKALQKPVQKQEPAPKQEVIKEIVLPEKMTIRELAEKMKMQPSAIVKKLFLEGIMVTVNHEIDFEKAQEIALDYEIIAEPEEKIDVIEELLKEDEEDEKELVARPPVVCVMGHVDHGKTSLLDAIRDSHVTDREAGGITQHIGAYVVTCNGEKITFLDTPGHEAFTAMRMRGANATDLAILVVAADDGVMPQTIEAINHAKAAGTEIIVAINKIDKPSANVERVKQELSEYQLIPEDWGGSTVFVPVSAKTHEGIDDLLEMILLTAEVAELKANPKRRARGLVIEAELDKGKGPVATILVQKGTLRVGDPIACGSCSGKVRAMMDDKGRRVKEAGPSTPVEILGLNDVPRAGEILVVTDNDKEAKNFAATFISENKTKLLDDTKARMSLDDLFTQIKAGNVKELPIIVKADVQGSVEAVSQSLEKLSNEEVIVKVIHGGVGAINESDVSLASASNAIIIGFNVRPDATAKSTAEHEGVDLRLYRVIYQAIEDVEAAMKGMLDAVYEEKVIGHALVRQIFKASVVGTIAGSYVTDGIFQRGCMVRITREGEQIYEGTLASLKRFKDDVKEVKTGFECGLVFDNFNDVKEDDQVEAYIMVEVPR